MCSLGSWEERLFGSLTDIEPSKRSVLRPIFTDYNPSTQVYGHYGIDSSLRRGRELPRVHIVLHGLQLLETRRQGERREGSIGATAARGPSIRPRVAERVQNLFSALPAHGASGAKAAISSPGAPQQLETASTRDRAELHRRRATGHARSSAFLPLAVLQPRR